MSLAPSTEANLLSRLFKSKKRPADAEMRGATGVANKDIERIALKAFFIIHKHRNQASATMKILDQKTIAFAAMKITGILN